MTIDVEPAVALPELTTVEQTYIDYALLGFCLDRHVLTLYQQQRRILHVVRSDRLAGRRSKSRVRVAGLVVCRQMPHTAKGYLFVTLEDEAGLVNVIVRPDVAARHRRDLRRSPMLLIDGSVQNDDGIVNVLAEEVRAFNPNPAVRSALGEAASSVAHDFR